MAATQPLNSEDWLAVVNEVDRLVRPWLQTGDQWRHGPNGWPLLEDALVAWTRLAGSTTTVGSNSPRADFELSVRGSEWFISAPYFVGEEESGYEPSEAATKLLLATLKRACVCCRQWDGHDWLCPVLLDELGQTREEAVRERDAERERVFGVRV